MLQVKSGMEIPDTLKCIQCKNYLSIPPIFVFTEGYICGRCIPDPKLMVVKATAYETLAKFFKFPCKNLNLGCETTYQFGQKHETKCIYQGLSCPIVESCTFTVGPNSILEHCKNNHNDFIISSNIFQISQKQNTAVTKLIILEKKPFILQIQAIKGQECKLGVYTLEPKFNNLLYNIEVNTNSRNTITLNQQKVTNYNLIGTTENLVSFNFDLIKQVLNSPNYNFKINLVGNLKGGLGDKLSEKTSRKPKRQNSANQKQNETPKPKEGNDTKQKGKESTKPKGATGPKPKEKEAPQLGKESTSSKQDKENSVKVPQSPKEKIPSSILAQLECVICSEYMLPPIFICKKGHSICSECRIKLNKCPTCEAQYEGARNYALEQLTENIEQPCKNRSLGCSFVGIPKNMLNHNEYCKIIKCPLEKQEKCSYTALLNMMREHIANTHPNSLWSTLNTELSRNLKSPKTIDYFITKFKRKLFKICIDHGIGSLFTFSVEDMSLTEKSEPKFKYIVEFIDKSSVQRILIVSGLCHAEIEEGIRQYHLILPDYLLKPFLDQNGTVYFKFEIKQIE